jgi:hypothetical protein
MFVPSSTQLSNYSAPAACGDLVCEDGPAPAVLVRLTGVPGAFFWLIESLQQADIMTPEQLCKKLLHDCLVRPRLGEDPHIFQVPRGEAAHVRKIPAQVAGQTISHSCPPTLRGLPNQDIAADLPIQQDQFLVDADSGAQPRVADPSFQRASSSGSVCGVDRDSVIG